MLLEPLGKVLGLRVDRRARGWSAGVVQNDMDDTVRGNMRLNRPLHRAPIRVVNAEGPMRLRSAAR